MADEFKPNAPGKGAGNSEERAAIERRLEGLDERLGKLRSEEAARAEAEEDARIHSRGMAYGLRMASELVGAILVGGLIGFGLDNLLGTVPWFFLLFFVVGLIAGMRNVVRGFTRLQDEIKASKGSDIGKDIREDDDDN
jgi:ATP synthase protein I